MKFNYLLPFCLITVLAISGCIADPETILTGNSVVKQFMAEHPNAEISTTHVSLSEFDDNKDAIAFYCTHNNAFVSVNKTIEPAEYYLVTVTDKESGLYIIAWVNWDEQILECAVKGDYTKEGMIEPPEWKEEPTIDEPVIQTVDQTAEQELQDAVCNALPTTATRLASEMMMIGLKIPNDFAQKVSETGSSITFVEDHDYDYYTDTGSYASTSAGYTGDKYIIYCFINSGDTHYCIMPMTANIAGEEKEGAIKLTFTGPVADLQTNPNAGSPCPTGQDCAVPKNWVSTSKLATPTYTRTGCEIDLQEDCPQKDGYVLCGQCEYSDFWNQAMQVSNLGQCRYCESGTSCYWSVSLCGTVNCLTSNGGGSNPVNQGKYLTSCSGCQTGQRSYYYYGYDWYTCNYYYQLCAANSCTDKRTNCA